MKGDKFSLFTFWNNKRLQKALPQITFVQFNLFYGLFLDYFWIINALNAVYLQIHQCSWCQAQLSRAPSFSLLWPSRFQLSPDEILNGLPLIDLSKTSLWEECPSHVKPIPCSVSRYRSYTGHCNNLKHSNWGAGLTPFVRHLPPVYADGKWQATLRNLIFLPVPITLNHSVSDRSNLLKQVTLFYCSL